MKDRHYKHKTKFLGIPVVGHRDGIWPEVEMRKYQIIENLLLACLQGCKNRVFAEGDLAVEENPDGSFKAILRPIGLKPALEGVVGGAYFRVSTPMIWDGLQEGNKYFLYVLRTAKTFEDACSVRTVISTHEKINPLKLFMAVVLLKDGNIVTDRQPRGKIKTDKLENHPGVSVNPHGTTMIQDELVVEKSLVLNEKSELVVVSDKKKVSAPVSCLIPEMVRFKTGGSTGTIVKTFGNPVFAQVSLECGDGASQVLGEVSVKYPDNDSKGKQDQIVICNSGDAGLSARVLIFFG